MIVELLSGLVYLYGSLAYENEIKWDIINKTTGEYVKYCVQIISDMLLIQNDNKQK